MAAAGPSRPSASPESSDVVSQNQAIEIPSTGLEFFEYRRRMFLAGLPIPAHPNHSPLPDTITVTLPLPDPLPSIPYNPSPKSSVGMLEALFAQEGAEDKIETQNNLAGISKALASGRLLSKHLRLGLVIKILKVGWIADGTWPIDPITSISAKPPDSPPLGQKDIPLPNRSDAETPPVPALAGLMGYGYGHSHPANQSSWPSNNYQRSQPSDLVVSEARIKQAGNDHG